MGKKALKSIAIGAALVVGSVLLPGSTVLLVSIKSAILAAGLSQTVGGIAGAIRGPLRDRQRRTLSNELSSTAPLPIVYGTARVAPAIVEVRAHPTLKNVHYVVGAICVASEGGGGIENIAQVYFDDRLAIDPVDTSGVMDSIGVKAPWNASGKEYLQYSVHLGTNAQAVDAELTTRFAALWPSTSKGAGIAYIVLRVKLDPEAYPSGLPVISCEVKGNKVFDPRSSTTVWSANPALAIRDFLTSTKYGCGIPTSEIDDATVIDAANYCDETVITTAYNGVRFACNGTLETGAPSQQALSHLYTSCRAMPVYQSGKFRLLIRRPTAAATFELTEDNIVGDWEYVRTGADAPNSITSRFIDPAWSYQVREVTWPEAGQANGFLTADNNLLSPAALELPFTTNYYIAQQIGMVTLRELREDITVALTAKEEALKLQVGDVVRLTHSSPGWTQKLFWVDVVAILPDATVRLVLREYDVNAYTLDTQNTDATVPGTDLPNPFTVAAPTGLTLVSNSTTALDTQGGEVVPRIKASWTPSTHPFVDRYDVEFKRTADAVWTPVAPAQKDETETLIWPVIDVTAHDVRIRAVNTIGVVSDWVSASVTTASKFGTPKIASVSVAWHESTDVLRIIVRGGVYVQSVIVEVDDDPNFGSPFQTFAATALSEGGQVNHVTGTLAQGDRDKPWYARARPFNAAGGTGIEGPATVGSARVEGNVTKTLRIPCTLFQPQNDTITYQFFNNGAYVRSGGVAAYTGQAPLELPDGVTITAWRARFYRATTNDTAEIVVYEIDDVGGAVPVGTTGAHSGTGWATVTVDPTDFSNAGKRYIIAVFLDPLTTNDDARMAWVEVDYIMPTLENTR